MNTKKPDKSNKGVDYFKELIMTFSNRKSLFSSKKIERFIVFNFFIILTIIYVFKNLSTLDSFEFVQIIGIWLAYGGYNSLMNLRDRKLENSNPTEILPEDENLN